jgi:hypothetical protein
MNREEKRLVENFAKKTRFFHETLALTNVLRAAFSVDFGR